MGRLFIESLPGPKIYRCKCCKVDSASPDDIVSKDFYGRFGKAYLFRSVSVQTNSSHNPSSVQSTRRGPRWKQFHGLKNGRNIRVNVCVGPTEERRLTSGLHAVNDIYCSSCQQILGWKYEKAYEESEKYKEGMYILEKAMIMKDGW
ncbi:putative yippee-like protein Os10g0369500 isoform X2 [Beta vulgaris subsp. vulgaris]|uniref:putative yippee-like protein Os10g0369500 isoform X2 n=1 Tax=Beta vulgaris subsp. vulgaris TaxID=3555 RepID=UPI0009017756|nr:putative yippee-like protein Os10g0369500 isoform X2 [Beta vulgaris subsp. vulgaris]